GVTVIHRQAVHHVDYSTQECWRGDSKARVPHVIAIGAVIPKFTQERENLVRHDPVHRFRGGVLEFAPSQMLLRGKKQRVLDLTCAGQASPALCEHLEVVEAANEKKVRELLDHFERVADAP